jgi:hypothetical protein
MRATSLISVASAIALSVAAPGLAQAGDPPGAYVSNAERSMRAAGIPTGPNPDYGLAVGDWLLYPSFFAGLVYNDNIYSQAFNRRSGVGIRLRPSVEAERETGIHKTNIYARADAQIYPGHGRAYQLYPAYSPLSSPTNVTGNVGFTHVYRPLPDLKFTALADYTRGSGGVFGGGFGITGVGNIPNAVSLVGVGTYSNQFTGSVAADKTFGDGFVRLGTAVQHIIYDSPINDYFMNAVFGGQPQTKAPASTNITTAMRVGYWMTPQFYAFIEPTADIRRSASWRNDTNGYKVVGGLGSDLISLFRGEIYAGYMSQASDHGYFGARGAPAFGGRLSYYPTRQLTLSLTVDNSFTAPVMQGQLVGFTYFYTPTAPTRTLQVKGQAEYEIADYWKAYARLGWGQSRGSGYYGYATLLPAWTYGTVTDVWGAGAGMSYNVWRNLALTLEYNFSNSNTRNPNNLTWWVPTAVTQNSVSAGLTYKY